MSINKITLNPNWKVGTTANSITNTNSGNVGIGTTSPSAKLEVVPLPSGIAIKVGRVSGKPSIRSISDTDWLIIDAGTGGSVGLNFWSTGSVILANGGGNVGIGVITPGSKFQVNGNAAIGYSASTAGPANGLAISGKVGIGIMGPTAKLDINSDILRLRTAKTPATAGAAGNQGDICWDTSYIYICIAADTWKRAAIAIW